MWLWREKSLRGEGGSKRESLKLVSDARIGLKGRRVGITPARDAAEAENA